jgi:hypothetical protein
MNLTLRKATGYGALIGAGIFIAIGGALSFLSIISKLPEPWNVVVGIGYAGALCGGAVGYIVYAAGTPPTAWRGRGRRR